MGILSELSWLCFAHWVPVKRAQFCSTFCLASQAIIHHPSPPTCVRFLGQKMRRQEAAKWVAMNCYTRRASTRLDSTRLWLPAGVLCDLAYPALPRPGLAWLNKRRRTYKEQAVKWAAAATGNSYENSNNNNSHTHTHTQEHLMHTTAIIK